MLIKYSAWIWIWNNNNLCFAVICPYAWLIVPYYSQRWKKNLIAAWMLCRLRGAIYIFQFFVFLLLLFNVHLRWIVKLFKYKSEFRLGQHTNSQLNAQHFSGHFVFRFLIGCSLQHTAILFNDSNVCAVCSGARKSFQKARTNQIHW